MPWTGSAISTSLVSARAIIGRAMRAVPAAAVAARSFRRLMLRSVMTTSSVGPAFATYCLMPLRRMRSSQETAAYMITANVESTSTATQTSAIS